MMICHFMIPVTFLAMMSLGHISEARIKIQWEKPEVVPEALTRKNRRVLKFSGITKTGTQIRVRKNKVKMIFPSGARWARIPKKHRVQFPVIASETGFFSFDLYLPTTPVEIPLEIFYKGRWRNYEFNFDVPESGEAERFDFAESFKEDLDTSPVVDDLVQEYDRKLDRGMVVNEESRKRSSPFAVRGALGFTYVNLWTTYQSNNLSIADTGDLSDLGFPFLQLGFEYEANKDWLFSFDYLTRQATMSADGNYALENKDFEWNELRFNVEYKSSFLKRVGWMGSWVFGLHQHDLPYLLAISSPPNASYRLASNDITFLAGGVHYSQLVKKDWVWAWRAMFLYSMLDGSDYDVDTGFGASFQVSYTREVLDGLVMGGQVELHWISIENEIRTGGGNISGDLTLWHLSPTFVIRNEF